jgi:hypothetical protein
MVLVLQRLGAGTAGQVLQTGGAGANPSWTNAPSGVIKKIHSFSRNTRSTSSVSANINAFTWTSSFVPLDAVNNSFYISGSVPIHSASNNFSGYGLRFQVSGTGTVSDFQSKGVLYASEGSGMQGIQSYFFVINSGVLSNSTYEIHHRFYTADNQAESYFPNSSDDSRLSVGTEGFLTIFEFKNN